MPLALKSKSGEYVTPLGTYSRDIQDARLYYAKRPIERDPILEWVEIRFIDASILPLQVWIDQCSDLDAG
jgi:hypothetical protein